MKKPKALKTASIACLLVMLCGCGNKIGACEAFSPVYFREGDYLTDATAREVLQNNEIGKNLLGWKNQ